MEFPSFCEQCGRKLQPEAKFCSGCGSQIAQASVSGEGMPSGASSSAPVALEPFAGQSRKTEPIFVQSPPIESSNRSDDAGPSGLLTNRIFFVLVYLVFVTPTYILPYFGSNSALANVTGAAMGLGVLPQFLVPLSSVIPSGSGRMASWCAHRPTMDCNLPFPSRHIRYGPGP